MSAQSDALRLADALELDPMPMGWCDQAAAELRRLHAENEAIHQAITDPENQPSQFGTVTFAMYEALEAQRDALLEACRAMLTFIERHAPRGLQPEPGSPVAMARAAIKAVEGENT